MAVRATSNGTIVGRTSTFFRRPDVEEHLQLGAPELVGFEMHVALPDIYPHATVVELSIELEIQGEPAPRVWQIARAAVRADDGAQLNHGTALRPSSVAVLNRADVYLTGPPSHAVNGEVLALLLRYLVPSGRLLDIGCGVGPFGPPLMQRGFAWYGVEVKDEDCRELARLALPHRHIEANERLPFDDASFDQAICLEVLEHVEDTAAFLSEVSRVVRGRTIFSVPNFEAVPLLSRHHVTPEHLLEPDHKNFFTRFSLGALLRRSFRRVEVIDYAALPIGDQLDETLPYHLLAIADNSP